jgi:hypothetical protein
MEGKLKTIKILEEIKKQAIEDEDYELAADMKSELDFLNNSDIEIDKKDVFIMLTKLTTEDRIQSYKELEKGNEIFLKDKMVERTTGFINLGQIDIVDGKVVINESDTENVNPQIYLDEYDKLENPTEDDRDRLYANVMSAMFGSDPEARYQERKREKNNTKKK